MSYFLQLYYSTVKDNNQPTDDNICKFVTMHKTILLNLLKLTSKPMKGQPPTLN